jgi:stage V sporulation protein B
LGRIIGSEGMAYYQTAYDLYILMLTISAYSIPIAISKLVSEKIELGRRDEAHKTFDMIPAIASTAAPLINDCLLELICDLPQK